MAKYPTRESREFGRRLRLGIKGSTYNQKQICELVEIGVQTLQNWLRGDSVPDALQMKKVSLLVEKPLGYFHGDEELSPVLMRAIKKIIKNQSAKN